MAFSTDGRIKAYNLYLLDDDKHFFPAYDAAPLVREATLKIHPEIKRALQPLANLIDNTTMQSLNYKVDMLKQSPAKVAHDFLIKKGLVYDNEK